MEYTLRKCEARDLEKLVGLCQKHAAYEQASYIPDGKKELLEQALFSEPQKLFCYVVEINGALGGYFSFTLDFSTWDVKPFLYLDCLYLEPEFRGHKIGEKIFDTIKEIATSNGCLKIQWQTPDFNERAIKFYNRIGGKSKNKVRFFMDLEQTD